MFSNILYHNKIKNQVFLGFEEIKLFRRNKINKGVPFVKIKFTKSSQFATELSNFKEKKEDIYTVIKIILNININNHGTSYDCSMIAEIRWKNNEELLYVVYTVKKIAENKINIYLERFGNKREYKNSFEIKQK